MKLLILSFILAIMPYLAMAQSVRTSQDYTIYFGLDKDTLDTNARQAILLLNNELAGKPNAHITLDGHTDRTGPARYNMDLSHRRAAAVKWALEGMDIAASRIESYGFGETDPAVATADGVLEPKNRRVEIRVETGL